MDHKEYMAKIGRKGGEKRMMLLSPSRRVALAKKAIAARWKKHRADKKNA